MLGGLAAVAMLVATIFYYRGDAISARADADRARADLETAVAVNQAQAETIGRMRAQQAANDKLLADMADQIAAINANAQAYAEAIEALKNADQSVRDYLNAVLPPDLGVQLNR